MNLGFREDIYEGILRLFSLTGDTADISDFRMVAFREMKAIGKPIWKLPETWEIRARAGYGYVLGYRYWNPSIEHLA